MILHVPVTDDETGIETTYSVHLELDVDDARKACWVLESITPTPPNDFAEERILELAARLADEAVDEALMEEAEWKADTKECEWE